MNRTELHMALRTLPFLDARRELGDRAVELSADPPKLLVWHPEAIDWIFRHDRELSHPGSRSLRPLFGDDSLLWADGPRHEAYREVLGPPLRGRRLTGYHGLIAGAVHEAVDALRPGTVVSLADWTRRLTLRIVGRLVLGRVDDAVLDAFSAWIDRALGSRSRTLAHRFLRGGLPRSGPDLDAALVRCARDGADPDSRGAGRDPARDTGGPATLASLMLDADGPLADLGDGELRDQIVSLLFAGHETTASAAAWTLYRLDHDAALRRDVTDELADVPDDVPAPARTPLLDAVIQEALRLAPPVTVAENRTLPQDTDLLGRTLPAGTTLTTSIYLAHRQPDAFPDPLRFDPSRFLGRRPAPRHYLPFGGGTRRCLGAQLGQLEIRMIAAALLRRRDWHCVNPRAGVLRLRGHAMAPSARLRMKVTGRRE